MTASADTTFEDLTFEDLPPGRRGGRPPSTLNEHIAAELMKRPGEWAHTRTSETPRRAASLAHHVRAGTGPSFRPKGSFEAASRCVDGEYRVYARYVGMDGDAL